MPASQLAFTPSLSGAFMFVHLHCHSHYSFLRGVASPEEIIATAVEQKMPAVALTDANGMYAAVEFYQAAKKAGIKGIVGAVLDVDIRGSKSEVRDSRRESRNSSVAVVLLAADMDGYSNLCRLVTLRHLGTTELAKTDLDGCDGRPLTLEELSEHCKDVIALCPLPAQRQGTSNRRSTIYRAPA